ncbi:hypothetical protein LINGRAHAP2_LOCUS33371 [Linum grandiflorum]
MGCREIGDQRKRTPDLTFIVGCTKPCASSCCKA